MGAERGADRAEGARRQVLTRPSSAAVECMEPAHDRRAEQNVLSPHTCFYKEQNAPIRALFDHRGGMCNARRPARRQGSAVTACMGSNVELHIKLQHTAVLPSLQRRRVCSSAWPRRTSHGVGRRTAGATARASATVSGVTPAAAACKQPSPTPHTAPRAPPQWRAGLVHQRFQRLGTQCIKV